MATARPLPVHDPIRKSDSGLPDAEPSHVTLLELVVALSGLLEDDKDVVDSIKQMIACGQVRLVGNFRDEPIDSFEIATEPPESS
ncbi:MAG: hypothetical protein GY944_21355 [bacterium]|nr:hypothetical protein [bacterium]